MGNNLPKPPHGLMGALNEKLLIEQLWFQALLLAFLLFILFMLYRYIKQSRLKVSTQVKEVSIEEKIQAVAAKLDTLEGLDLISKLDESLKLYFEFKSQKDFSGKTYEEILSSGLLNQFSNENREKISSFYKFCEKIKYARAELAAEELGSHKFFIKALLDGVSISEEVK